jgi:sugar phosphate isomerase/epimerase
MLLEDKWAFMASLGFSSQSPEEVVGTLSELGYSGVEWTMAHVNPRAHSASQRKHLADCVSRAGLTSTEWVVQQDLVAGEVAEREDRIRLVEECMAVAHEAGMDVINLFSGPAPWDPRAPKLGAQISEGEAWDRVFAAFDRFVPLAETHRVHLAVEAVFGMSVREFYTVSHLLSHYDSPWLGVNLDPSHYVLYGNDALWAVRQLKGRIKHVHLKDVVGVPGMPGQEFLFPLLGEGRVPWKAFVSELERAEYSGFLSVEFESFSYYRDVLQSDPRRAAALSMEQLRHLLG